jgi:hypothetical protein
MGFWIAIQRFQRVPLTTRAGKFRRQIALEPTTSTSARLRSNQPSELLLLHACCGRVVGHATRSVATRRTDQSATLPVMEASRRRTTILSPVSLLLRMPPSRCNRTPGADGATELVAHANARHTTAWKGKPLDSANSTAPATEGPASRWAPTALHRGHRGQTHRAQGARLGLVLRPLRTRQEITASVERCLGRIV